MKRIACIGDNCIDYYDDSGVAYPGGNPVNVAVYTLRLGGKASYIGAVGEDRFGTLLKQTLAEKGVDISHVKVLPGKTAITHVTMESGNRVLGEYDEGVMAEYTPDAEDVEYVCTHDLVVTGLWGHSESVLEEIHLRGIPVAFDGAERPFDHASLVALPHTDVAFFSDDLSEEKELREKVLRVAALGPGIVVATRGDRGSLAYDGKQFYIQNAIPCEIVDTMGAGDSFIAGFLMSWIQGDSIPNSMNAGAENAAITIGYSGGW